jgi:predicted O-linked N-acetylglucosamine transferase (SPINDLY family)
VPLPASTGAAITFGSFNNLAKVNEAVVAAWARIVAAVPASRLLLKARPLNDPATRARYQAQFEAAGIPSERLILQSTATSWADHMAHYAAVDIALDPFPYNGTTTTCDALWMGVPVITWRGDRHASRVGASLLSQLALDELIAEDLDGYVATAAALAADRPRLAGLRATLRDRLIGSPLGDAKGFTRALESAYRDIWRDCCARQSG